MVTSQVTNPCMSDIDYRNMNYKQVYVNDLCVLSLVIQSGVTLHLH